MYRPAWVLPVLNKQAVIYAYSLAKALKMKVNYKSEFARKNYFYTDLPKNYQISQYEYPLGEQGIFYLVRENLEKKVRIRRIHSKNRFRDPFRTSNKN